MKLQKGRKIREGVVFSNKMNKTLIVNVARTILHPRYKKVVTRAKKYYAHYEKGTFQVGQRVRIQETRPLSKLKHWLVIETLSL